MKHRKMGKLDEEVSALGFGAMRFPTKKDGDSTVIERIETIEMLSYAFDNGVNYIDTAWPYHNGESEVVVGEALKNGYRDRVNVATKLPSWAVQQEEDFDRFLNEQLKRLQTETIDFYLLHCINASFWERLTKLNVLEWGEKAKYEGRIKHFGFSFHDNVNVFKEVIDEYDWDLCQIQYNYMNEQVQAGTEGYMYASNKGIPVVIMEPLLGGSLVNLPPKIQELFNNSSINVTPVELALKWLWNKPEVSIVLSGMSSLEQVKENIRYAKKAEIGYLTAKEAEFIEKIKDTFDEINPIPCTNCGYCMPCPVGIDIPRLFSMYNDVAQHEEKTIDLNRNLYGKLQQKEKAASCISCEACEGKCPQEITVSEWMPKIDEKLKF